MFKSDSISSDDRRPVHCRYVRPYSRGPDAAGDQAAAAVPPCPAEWIGPDGGFFRTASTGSTRRRFLGSLARACVCE